MRKAKYDKILTKKFLIKEYIVNKKSCQQIANEVRCGAKTVSRYLVQYNIKIRTISEDHIKYSKILTKVFLIEEYIKNKKKLSLIAKETNCAISTVYSYLIKYNIPIRDASEARLLINCSGKNNPNYTTGKSLKPNFCKACGKKIGYQAKRCGSCSQIGKLAYNWNNGSSFEPYPIDWTAMLRETIRVRDNHQCQICGKSTKKNGRKLDVHHIDYDKNNLNPDNLISLCCSCHCKSNSNRDIYIEFFSILKECIK